MKTTDNILDKWHIEVCGFCKIMRDLEKNRKSTESVGKVFI